MPGGQEVGAEAAEDLAPDPLFFAQQPQQEMLAADMIVAEEAGFFDAVLDHLFDAGAERNLAEGHRGSPSRQVPLDFQADLLGREPHLLQDHQGNAIGFAENG